MDKNLQLQNLRDQLQCKRQKLIHDPDIPSQTIDRMMKEMTELHNEIQQLEAEVSTDNEHHRQLQHSQ
jgi:predicted  nucleic acid-binding Zn-ribbon protein